MKNTLDSKKLKEEMKMVLSMNRDEFIEFIKAIQEEPEEKEEK